MNTIEQLRKQNNLSQSEMAKIAEMSQSNYSKYERGKLDISVSVAKKIATYFDVSLDFLANRQFNNHIGYIPEDKKNLVKLILQLKNQRQLDKAEAYLMALLDAEEEVKKEIKY